MPPSIPAYVNKALLIWGREDAGLSIEQAAKKVRVKVERLKAWEDGERKPSVAQLKALGRVYRRPIAVFFLANPLAAFRPMHDYRRLAGREEGFESPELHYQVRRAHERRALALELVEVLGESVLPMALRIQLTDDHEAAGRAVRDFLGVTVQQQRAWHDAREAFNEWRAALERNGVLVFQTVNVPVSEARGFSISEQPFPVVAVNRKDALYGRIFTLVHELTHLAVERGGLCDLREGGARSADDERVEVFCNAVAAAALMPAQAVLDHTLVRTSTGQRQAWSDEELDTLSRDFRVSSEAALRRLLTLGRTTKAFYEHKRREYLQAPPPDKTRVGRIARYADALSTGGRLFAGLVLRGYYEERITSSDVADALNLGLKHLGHLEQALAAARPTV